MGDVVTPRQFRSGPAPDDQVWVGNSFYVQEPDGTWRAWIEPLDAEDGQDHHEIEGRGATATEARDRMRAARRAHTTALGESTPELEKFYDTHGMYMKAKDVFRRPWPPPDGYWETLAFAKKNTSQEE